MTNPKRENCSKHSSNSLQPNRRPRRQRSRRSRGPVRRARIAAGQRLGLAGSPRRRRRDPPGAAMRTLTAAFTAVTAHPLAALARADAKHLTSAAHNAQRGHRPRSKLRTIATRKPRSARNVARPAAVSRYRLPAPSRALDSRSACSPRRSASCRSSSPAGCSRRPLTCRAEHLERSAPDRTASSTASSIRPNGSLPAMTRVYARSHPVRASLSALQTSPRSCSRRANPSAIDSVNVEGCCSTPNPLLVVDLNSCCKGTPPSVTTVLLCADPETGRAWMPTATRRPPAEAPFFARCETGPPWLRDARAATDAGAARSVR